jgi:MSHA biogenesis protein MshQ
LSGTGGLTNDTNATLNLGGTSAITTLTASATGNTVNYTQAGPQTVKATSYVNLGGSGSGVKSLADDVTVGGTLTLSGATLAVGANTLTLNGPTIAGTPANLTTTTASSLVFGGGSSGVSVPASVTALNNLTVNNASGVTLGGSPTLNGTLTLTSGVITTGSNTLTLAAFCPGSASRASGYVNGNLTLAFPTGNPTCTFHVGDSIGYAPITVTMTGVTVAGRLAGRVDAGDHPDTASSISGIEASKSANHYWTLTAGTPAPSYVSYAATFQFCASTASCVTPSEVDVGAVTGNFMVARKSGSSWSMPTVGARTAYSTQATGITSVEGFGVFAVGEVSLCFTDAFTGVDGSSPGSNWSVNSRSGSFGNPVIVGNRLRLTNATTTVATWATLLRPIPAYGNKVVVEFDYYAYGGSGGDGMAVVLSEGAVSPVAGAFGGSLGYAQKSNPGSDCTVVGGCPGFAGGWLGIGLDAFGNYTTNTEGRNGGVASQVPDSVAVRGSGTGVSGYRFLQGTGSLSPGVDGAFSPAHRYRITMDHSNNVNAYTSVERDTGSGYVSVIAPFDVKDPGYSQSLVPTMFNLTFTGATGTSTNIHEIDNVKVCSLQALVAPTLNHIRLEHGGSACSGNAATVTVKACADAACSSLYNGSVTVNLTATAGTWNTNPVTFTGQTDVTLTYGTTGSVTLGGTATSPTTGNATRCFNGVSETCTLTYNACSVDVVEVGAALGAPIYTKLAGVAFNLDVVRFSGNQTINIIQLVNASSGTCSTYPSLGATTTTLPLTLNNTTPRRTVAFTYNDAAANARVRVTNSAGVVSCSSDNFAIRPQAFAVTSSATQTGSSGTPVFRAGADAFSVTATAVYGATTTPGYVAAPKFNASLVSTSQAQLGALTATAFVPVPTNSGTSKADGFKYGEVGNFNLGQYAVYDDAFAAVDAVKGECTTGFSNALDGNGKYSCQFGSAAVGPFGRFVPNHFTVTPSVANACAAGSFTYLGQPFNLSTASVVEARNAGNAITVNYAGVFAPGVVTFAAENADSGTDLGASLVYSDTNGALSGSWTAGVYTLEGSASPTVIKFTRPSTPAGPFDALDIGLTVTDTDVGTVSVAGADMNPVVAGTATHTHKKFSGSPLSMRYGRLRLLNAYGSERLPLPMVWETQYWNGQSFIRHTQDSCTTLAAANIALSNYQSPPNPGGTVLAPANLNAVAVGAINAGRGTITLAPTQPAIGSVDLVANLGSSGSPKNCPDLGYGSSTSAGLAYLSGQWCEAANNRDPTARASFGVFKSPLIYRRENY